MSSLAPPVALSIAGSDSGGGAGVQADLKAFAACGVHGTTAITAITAQNTVGVEAISVIPPETIIAQVHAVVGDIGVDAVKIGMLADEPTIAAVATALDQVGAVPIVVDPVMVSESGATLLEPEARRALIESILPRARVVTPNLPEARTLLGAGDEASVEELGHAILDLGPGAVIVTGGHTTDGADTLITADALIAIGGPRHPDGAAHGSGCTHSSALAAFLAQGFPLADAALRARAVAGIAIRDGIRGLGAGAGPVDAAGVAGRRSAVIAGSFPPLESVNFDRRSSPTITD